MKTILWATLTANGNYAQSGPNRPPKKEALEDFATQAKKAGNIIVGRNTFEGFQSDPNRKVDDADNVFAGIEMVVVSGKGLEIPGVKSAASPRAALDYLEQKGYETALLSGGESLHNAFLDQNLVDELIFNFAPTLESEGLKILLTEDQYKEVKLLDFKDIGGGLIQLHYALNR